MELTHAYQVGAAEEVVGLFGRETGTFWEPSFTHNVVRIHALFAKKNSGGCGPKTLQPMARRCGGLPSLVQRRKWHVEDVEVGIFFGTQHARRYQDTCGGI